MTKDQIIDRLLHKNQITPEEAEILRSKEQVFIQQQIIPEPKQFQEIYKQKPKHPYQIEFERVQNHIKNCPCNPENGGSGVCGCTMGTMPVIC